MVHINCSLLLTVGLLGLMSRPILAQAGSQSPSDTVTKSSVATLATTDLKEYDEQPVAIQKLIAQGLSLTRLNLSYKYGSSDPKNGGMDCSGTIYYLLSQAGLQDVPRDASEIYTWVWKQSHFQAVVSRSADTFELSRLKPGDLLFWSGTYHVNRDPPITHVMIYLGTNRQTGRRVMLGASEGRTFNNISRYGVSVFDFKMPSSRDSSSTTATSELESRFVGYGPTPGLKEIGSNGGREKSLANP
jgi:cell wall-associated NlpC family hydrolase